MFAKICGNVCKESFFACLLISPEIWSGVYHFAGVSKMIGKKGGCIGSPICSQAIDCPRYFTAEFVKT